MSDLRNKSLSIETGENPGYADFLPYQFMENAERNYLAARLLIPYRYLFYSKIAHSFAECLEKIMKAYLMKRCSVSVGEIENNKKYGHNLEYIRSTCSVKDQFFDDQYLKDFCQNYSGAKKGNEILRYGFGKQTKGYGFNLDNIVTMADKFFLGTFLKIEDSDFFLSNSTIASLFHPTIFQTHLRETLGNNFEMVQNLVRVDNALLKVFIKAVENFYTHIKTQKGLG